MRGDTILLTLLTHRFIFSSDICSGLLRSYLDSLPVVSRGPDIRKSKLSNVNSIQLPFRVYLVHSRCPVRRNELSVSPMQGMCSGETGALVKSSPGNGQLVDAGGGTSLTLRPGPSLDVRGKVPEGNQYMLGTARETSRREGVCLYGVLH